MNLYGIDIEVMNIKEVTKLIKRKSLWMAFQNGYLWKSAESERCCIYQWPIHTMDDWIRILRDLGQPRLIRADME